MGETGGLLVKQLHDSIERRINNDLRKQGLTMMQHIILQHLHEAEGHRLPTKQLENLMKVAQPTVAGLIARLEQKGFVERFGDQRDRRMKYVQLTREGESARLSTEEFMFDTEDILFAGFSPEKKAEILACLRKMADNLREN